MAFQQSDQLAVGGTVGHPSGGHNEYPPHCSTEDEFAEENPPDGGYGWVCVSACFVLNAFTWGTVSVSSYWS